MRNKPALHTLILIKLCILCVVVSGCFYDNEVELYPGTGSCDTLDISFSEVISPLIQANCNISGCHVSGGTGNGIFENYDQIRVKVDNGSLENRVVILRDMPPGASLNECQISQFQSWLDAGAPDN
jgi:hypothetical protein